jgi:cytochrome P450
MLRSIRRMRSDTLGFLADCSKRYGPVVRFPIPGQDVYFVNHPDGARRVLQGNHRAYGRRTIQYDTLALLTGQGLLTNDGPSWLSRRRMAQPAFGPSRLAMLDGFVSDALGRQLEPWLRVPEGTVVDVDEAMMRVALDVVGRALFSADFGGQADDLIAAVVRALDLVVERSRSLVRLPSFVPTASNLRMRAARGTVDAAVASILAQRRGLAHVTDDLLASYLSPRDGADALSDVEIRDEVVTLLVAGHETVASSMTWTMKLLGDHPQARERLQAEVDTVLGQRPPTHEDIPRLPYTGHVVAESLRLYPPAWLISRRAVEDDVVCGFAVPAGSLIILSAYVTQRDPQWWPEADRFDPDRWIGQSRRDAYFPFGAGPNLCIGRDFALTEQVLMLAAMTQRFTLEPLSEQPVRALPLVTIRPEGGLPMRLTKRS